jgi:hypothetical protein
MTVGTEQRRSRRFQSSISVDIIDKKGTRRGQAVDVARHGIFVAVGDLPANRHLVQLRIHLPDGDIEAAATVARGLAGRGVGLAFFAMTDDARARWDTFVLGTHDAWMNDRARRATSASSAPPGRSASTSTTPMSARGSTFFLRLHSVARLRDYRLQHVEAGGTILFTPALLPAGSPVTLVVVHPTTQAEFPLYGTVHRAIRATPKRLEILFVPADVDAFARFTDTGTVPRTTTTIPPTAVAAGAGGDEVEIEFDIDDADIGSEPVDWKLQCKVPSSTPAAATPTATDAELGDDVDLAIEIPDAGLLTQEGRAVGESVSAFSVPIHDPVTLPDFTPPDVTPPHVTPPHVARPADAPDPERRRVRIACDRCNAPSYVVEFGRCAGALGLVADLTPFLNPGTGRIVTVPRLVALTTREARIATTPLPAGGTTAVALADVLAAAALADLPRHPETGEALRSSRSIDRLSAAALHLVGADDIAATRVACPACTGGHLALRLA